MSYAETEVQIPKGYLMDAHGRMVPKKMVSEHDLLRDKLVKNVAHSAKKLRDPLTKFKRDTENKIEAFIQQSADAYDAKIGGNKGNVSLFSFDGKYKLVRTFGEQIHFDERIQIAKALIDECIITWSKGSNANIKALVMHAFQADQQGKISKDRVLGLKRLDIDDEKWLLAMQAITDSMLVLSRKSYIRVYERDANGEYQAIALDIAAL